MRRLAVFNSVTLDGFFADANGDMSWAYAVRPDAEYTAFVEGNASAGGMLVFGRVTYELMARYWPTPLALQNDPIVARRMNEMPKVVFSRTLDEAAWSNTTLIKADLPGAIRRLKREPGPDMAILGSGSVVSQLAREGLIDEFQIVVVPVVLGGGRTMFGGVTGPLAMKLTRTRSFGNGNVFLCYEPAG